MDEATWPDGPPGSRFAEVSRRAFLRRSAAVAGVVAVGGLAAACGGGNGDKVLASASTDDATASTASGPSTSVAAGTGPTSGTASAGALPAGAELTVAFTYAFSDVGGRVQNPYIAVWIEDAKEALVKTVGLWYQAGPKERYLGELQRWASENTTTDGLAAVSSATRAPGAYSLVWDGTAADGSRVPAGRYWVNIEAAREHGPYSLIRQELSIGSAPSTTKLADNGELSGATAHYVVG